MTVYDSREARRADLQSLYAREVRTIYGFLLARCGDRHLAEDLTTETFINAADRFADGHVIARQFPQVDHRPGPPPAGPGIHSTALSPARPAT